MSLLIEIIYRLIQLFTLIVVIDVLLSYFMSPFAPVRLFLDRVVEPFLRPIRRMVPPINGLDFSPLILILLLQLVGGLVVRLLSSF